MTALLITGSRSLARSDEAVYDRCIYTLRWALDTLRPSVVIAGDADGPDAWARELASHRGILIQKWCLDGRVEGYGPRRWATIDEVRVADPRRWPLVRNARMVASTAARYTGATCLAMIDPASRTHGTENTARAAGRAGLQVIPCTYGT